ncbi:SusC/RagA family TonB-linked outer membrane protein [Segatella maculosa]|uniref:SusC/RagA family TonB-linked outer membrane protein n=1 Tax=Segatella maculosa OT 289 TaxID=999422 RepID=H1HQ16_9BACT|nr:TonB-dependent receptor [Segatella maculosa]EHO67016.1 SusC/RagA family TonB-linked outer membrane protein [Segatella maculosa OT 289]
MSINLNRFRIVLIGFLLLLVGDLSAQTIKGTVKDSSGEPVIGATVMEQGMQGNGVVTDLDGNFTLNLKGNGKKITVSYIGMKTQTIDAAGKSMLHVTLEDAATSLNDVIVIGYGSVKRKDITGSVATVSNEALAAVPVASASEALTGKLAGVQVSTSEGSPDATVRIRVRGGGSITQSNDPLFIVDGFPVDDISNIPATDIDDITVLKDASSTAIYGSRGANGVILVTTKSGKVGKVNVSYNTYYSWKKIAKKMNVLSPGDYAKWQYELALLKNNNDPNKISSYTDYFGNYQDLDLYNNVKGNDWQDMTYGRTGHTYNHNLSVTGGTDNVKYSFSYAHIYDKAIMVGSSFKRDNFSLKLNTKPSKTTTFDLQARFSDTDVRGGGANDSKGVYNTDKRLKDAVIYPVIPLKGLDEANTSFDDSDMNIYDPITSAADNDRKKQNKNLNIAGAFGWEVYKNLTLKTEFGYDYYTMYDQRFFGLTSYQARNYADQAFANHPLISLDNDVRETFRNTNTINYDFKNIIKNKNHSLNMLLGHEYLITKEHDNLNQVVGFPTSYDADTAWRLSSQGTASGTSDFYNPDDKLLSFFTRANYSYKDKYLASFTFRADASSKFSKNNRWGYFPSAALAWRVTSEKFMEGTKNWIDDLKLRFSLGTAGNNNILSGQLIQEYMPYDATSSQRTWVNGFSNPLRPSSYMANPNLKWETTITRNIGVDWTLLRGKLNGSFEFYKNTTKDLLIAFPVSGTGYEAQYRNLGKTQNQGFEATFTWHVIDKKNWGIDLSGNINFNKSKIKQLGINNFYQETHWASSEIDPEYIVAVGGHVGEIVGYQNAGRYEVSDFTGYNAATDTWTLKDGVDDATAVIGKVRPGSLKLKDQDGDHKITANDKTKIGDVAPDCYGGFNINARAYGFDLGAQFNYSIGNQEYNANKIEYTTTGKYIYRNMIDAMADGKRWTNLDPKTGLLSNDPVRLAQLNENTTMWSPYMGKMVLTDWAIEDASFLRLSTLTLGYTLPKELTRRVGINSLRLYCTGYNLFTLTGYSGFDPESDTVKKTALTPGVDYSAYPKSRSFVIGLNLNF